MVNSCIGLLVSLVFYRDLDVDDLGAEATISDV